MSGISEVRRLILTPLWRLSPVPIRRLLLVLSFAVLLAGCSSLTSLYFYPQTVWIQTPDKLGLQYQDIWLEAADGTSLHAWWLPSQSHAGDAGTTLTEFDTVVLYLHGNAENISSHIRSVDWLPGEGFALLALDYRGYGASAGTPYMPAVLQDVEAAAAWIRQHYPDKRLLVLGQSIGAALAVNFVAKGAQRYGVDALVLDAPFAGFPRIARSALTSSWLGWLLVPATWLIPADWDPQTQAAGIQVPTLVMHSRDDAVIPRQQGRAVYQVLAGDKCWLDSKGPHIASFSFAEIRRISQLFMQSLNCAQVRSALASE